MINLRALHAKWTLGFALLKHVALKPILPLVGDRGGPTWLSRVAEENLEPAPPESWSYVASTSGCIGCGLCDLAGEGDESPSAWVMAAARRPQDAPLAVEGAERLQQLASEISRICPTRVSGDAVARLLTENAAALGQRRQVESEGPGGRTGGRHE